MHDGIDINTNNEKRVLSDYGSSIPIVIDIPELSVKKTFTDLQEVMDFLETLRKDSYDITVLKNVLHYGFNDAYTFTKTYQDKYREGAADFICTLRKLSDKRKMEDNDPTKRNTLLGMGNLTIIPFDVFAEQLFQDYPKYLRMYCSNANFFRNVFMSLWLTGIIEFCTKDNEVTGISVHDENLTITSGLKPFTM